MVLWDFSDCGANCHKQCKDLLVLACRRFARAPSLGSGNGSLPGSPSLPPGSVLYFLSNHDLYWVPDLILVRVIVNKHQGIPQGEEQGFALEFPSLVSAFGSH